MPKRKFGNSRNVEDSLCISYMEFDVCPSMYTFGYIIHSWGIRQIFKQSRNRSLESSQKSYEVFEENKVLYAHIQEVRSVGDYWYSDLDFTGCLVV